MAVKNGTGSYMALPMNIKRGNPIPLDTTSVWPSLAALQTYAQTGATAYVGQILALVTDTVVEAYQITSEAGTLVKLAATTASGDLTADITALQSRMDTAEADIEALEGGKVDKVEGKGLSTEDFTTAEKTKLAAFSEASTYALKSDIVNVYKYQGSVAAESALPTEGLTAGDVYNLEDTGMNVAWTGTSWDNLGEVFTITSLTNDDLDTVCI